MKLKLQEGRESNSIQVHNRIVANLLYKWNNLLSKLFSFIGCDMEYNSIVRLIIESAILKMSLAFQFIFTEHEMTSSRN